MDFTTVFWCEIDRAASAAYSAVHGIPESLNLGDITAADEYSVPEFTVMTGGSPCQDFSMAGNRRGAVWTCRDCGKAWNPLSVRWQRRDRCPCCGGRNIDRTRSSLLVEWLRFMRAGKPRLALYENVSSIAGSMFGDTFSLFVREMEEYGYSVSWRILNAADFGLPQRRERLYAAAVRKDLDTGNFRWPEPRRLETSLRELLDPDAGPRYWMADSTLDTFRLAAVPRRPLENPVVRRLTPAEGWRIMGFRKSDCEKARQAVSSRIYGGRDSTGTQLMKMAGNSIAVPVLTAVITNLYDAMPHLFEDMRLASFFSGIGAFERAFQLAPERTQTRPPDSGGNPNILRIGSVNSGSGMSSRVYDDIMAATLTAAGTGWYCTESAHMQD